MRVFDAEEEYAGGGLLTDFQKSVQQRHETQKYFLEEKDRVLVMTKTEYLSRPGPRGLQIVIFTFIFGRCS